MNSAVRMENTGLWVPPTAGNVLLSFQERPCSVGRVSYEKEMTDGGGRTVIELILRKSIVRVMK